MNRRALCWGGSIAILLVSLALIYYGHGWIAVIMSTIGQISWGIFTGLKGWRFFR